MDRRFPYVMGTFQRRQLIMYGGTARELVSSLDSHQSKQAREVANLHFGWMTQPTLTLLAISSASKEIIGLVA